MAHLRGWSSDGTATSSAPARLRYKPLLGEHHFIPAGAGGSDGIVLPNGVQLIFDFGRFREGEIAFAPKYDDTRMVLRGDPLPPYSGDPAYTGGIQLDVLVQQRGLCVLTSTSASMIRAIDLLHDEYVCAPEAQAGKLPIYRLEEPRSYTIQQRTDPLFAPVYRVIGWAVRDSLKLGERLILPPKPLPSLVTAAPPALESDDVFESASRTGEVVPRGPQGSRSERRGSWQTPAGDLLDDEIPF